MAQIAGSAIVASMLESSVFTPAGDTFLVSCSAGAVSVLIQPPGSSDWFLTAALNGSTALPGSLIAGGCVPVGVDVVGSKYKLQPHGVSTAAAWEA